MVDSTAHTGTTVEWDKKVLVLGTMKFWHLARECIV